jgi:amino acid permease
MICTFCNVCNVAMVSYNVIVGDTITRVVARLIGYDILWSRDIVTLVTSVTLTFPLSLYR